MRNLFRIASCCLPANFILSRIGSKTVFPFYHLVSDNPPKHVKHLYKVLSSKEFECALDFFLKYFIPIESSTLVKIINDDLDPPKSSFHLSFDDGFREVKDVVAPILQRKGIPATFFVNPAYIGNLDMMYRCKCSLLVDKVQSGSIARSNINEVSRLLSSKNSLNSIQSGLLSLGYDQTGLIEQVAIILGVSFSDYLLNEQPYLTLNDLMELKKSGFTIGGHGYNHPYFSRISNENQVAEVNSSMQWVKSNFTDQPFLFAFPFTDYGVSDEFISGLTSQPMNCCDLSFGTAGMQPNRLKKHLQRIPMEQKCFDAKHIVEGEILYYLAKDTIGYYKKYDKSL